MVALNFHQIGSSKVFRLFKHRRCLLGLAARNTSQMFPLDSRDSSHQVQHMVDHAQPLYLWPLCLQCPTASGGKI